MADILFLTDGQRDSVILICLLKFFRGHNKKNQFHFLARAHCFTHYVNVERTYLARRKVESTLIPNTVVDSVLIQLCMPIGLFKCRMFADTASKLSQLPSTAVLV